MERHPSVLHIVDIQLIPVSDRLLCDDGHAPHHVVQLSRFCLPPSSRSQPPSRGQFLRELEVGDVARVDGGEEAVGDVEVNELDVGRGVGWGVVDEVAEGIGVGSMGLHLDHIDLQVTSDLALDRQQLKEVQEIGPQRRHRIRQFFFVIDPILVQSLKVRLHTSLRCFRYWNRWITDYPRK